VATRLANAIFQPALGVADDHVDVFLKQFALRGVAAQNGLFFSLRTR
jgi:hypothetical protein